MRNSDSNANASAGTTGHDMSMKTDEQDKVTLIAEHKLSSNKVTTNINFQFVITSVVLVPKAQLPHTHGKNTHMSTRKADKGFRY